MFDSLFVGGIVKRYENLNHSFLEKSSSSEVDIHPDIESKERSSRVLFGLNN